MLTEKRLIKDCQQGVKSSQYELVKRYSSMLMAVSLRYVCDHSTAQDIVQESFIRIFSNIGKYKPTGSFKAWMRKIAIRLSLQWLGKSHVRHEVSPEIMPEPEAVAPAIYQQLGAEEIMQLIQELPPGFRAVFNLNIIEGYSHKEIAELLGITESTSRSQLVRARAILKKKLQTRSSLKIPKTIGMTA